MGTVQHDTVIAVFRNMDHLEKVEKFLDSMNLEYQQHVPPFRARNLFAMSPPLTNSCFAVVMFPDGSNESWPESDRCDIIRQKFVDFCKSIEYTRVHHLSFGELGIRLL